MATVVEALPVRPRKASASRRRRHQTQLAHRINCIAPGAVTVLVTPLWTDPTGVAERHFVARALNSDGKFLKFEAGGSRQITALLQGAWPQANWSHPQSWRADTNTLTDRISQKVVAS